MTKQEFLALEIYRAGSITDDHTNSAYRHYEGYANDLKKFRDMMVNGEEPMDPDIGNFYEYGLSLTTSRVGDINTAVAEYLGDPDEICAWYEMCWGGPQAYFIITKHDVIFCYLDWFIGLGYDVTGDDRVNWLIDYFDELGYLGE